MSDTREEIYRKINVINEKLNWIDNYIERDGMLSQKRGLERQLEEMDRIEKEELY